MHSASSAVVLATLAISSLRVVATASASEVPGRGTKQGIAQWATGRNFLRAGLVAESDVKAFLSDELSAAGATSRSGVHQHLVEIRQSMNTMYTSLPKNLNGKLTHQAVRYALHRYFVHRHGWFIRGLEPNNDTWHGAADPDNHNSATMSEWVPSYLQDILETRLGQDGSDLNQLAALAAALGDLIRKEEKGRLEAVYRMYELPVQPLARELADDLLLTYYVAFLNSGDFSATSQKQARLNTQDFISDYTGWAGAYSWLEELKKNHLASTGKGNFNFQDLAHLVDKMGEEYYVLNDRDCDDLKETLRTMQGVKPGRVRLSQFYHMGMYSHWDFAEKREYLSALGVLDESDPEHPFVIIANYAMARPNCLDSSNLFTICCRNECEDLMGNLESEIGSSTAEPARVAELVAAMPSATIGAHRVLPAQLINRLEEIAARHGGQVPLHGRLFTQWMHHAYPLECPYPHEAGTVNPLTRSEWIKETGHDSEKASTEEMMQHIASDSCAVDAEGAVKCAESADLPWSDNEELLTWHPHKAVADPRRPSAAQGGCSRFTALVACILAVVGLIVAVRYRSRQVAWRPLGLVLLLALIAFASGLLDETFLILVLACGSLVAVANQMTARPIFDDTVECKQGV